MSNIMKSRKTRVAAVLAAGALSVGASAGPAMAAPVVTGGLVNVTIVDAVDIDRVTVQLPLAAALNVCNTNVLSLVVDSATGARSCTANADSRADNRN